MLCIWPTEQLQKLAPPSAAAGLLVSHYVQKSRIETVYAENHCHEQRVTHHILALMQGFP